MPLYRVFFEVVAETYIDIVANDEEEAMDQAEAAIELPDLCDSCESPLGINDLGAVIGVEEID